MKAQTTAKQIQKLDFEKFLLRDKHGKTLSTFTDFEEAKKSFDSTLKTQENTLEGFSEKRGMVTIFYTHKKKRKPYIYFN